MSHALESTQGHMVLQRSASMEFTSTQAALYLGVSLASVRRWTDDGKLRCVRTPGGQRRFSREDLDQFLEDCRKAGQAGEM